MELAKVSLSVSEVVGAPNEPVFRGSTWHKNQSSQALTSVLPPPLMLEWTRYKQQDSCLMDNCKDLNASDPCCAVGYGWSLN